MTGTTRREVQMAESALSADEALQLLGQVRFGRVVFTSRAMPAVRPVRHVVADGQIIIAAGPELVLGSSHATTTPTSGTGTIVAFEADEFDVTGRRGWSVVVVGRTSPVTDEAEARLYRTLLPGMAVPDQLVAISADVVSGFRVSDVTRPAAADH